jgi:hypothetical protein
LVRGRFIAAATFPRRMNVPTQQIRRKLHFCATAENFSGPGTLFARSRTSNELPRYSNHPAAMAGT